MISSFQEIKCKSLPFSLCFGQKDGRPGSTVSYFFSPVMCQKEGHACVLASSAIKNNARSGVCGISVYEILFSRSLGWTGFIQPAFSSSLSFSVWLRWGLRIWGDTLEIHVSHSCCTDIVFISTVVIHCPKYQHWLAGRKCTAPVFVARRHTECQRSKGSVP